ncbi:MAG: hypothetical protein Faunusvirus36_6 [Faunusvirus sp.]|jgi:hypothetical protein|uniref:Uncharacterized protein n=1 Tax=Faunusvirus sp. TaxID=2487766 RepID=A0A3G5A2G8_9VIRU|nr:MAG: hypothetical protein Faunusvirus36_6 [Faunusvirus sp.]
MTDTSKSPGIVININNETASIQVEDKVADINHNYIILKRDVKYTADKDVKYQQTATPLTVKSLADLDKQLDNIAMNDLKGNFHYYIALDKTLTNLNEKKWHIMYDRTIGDFFWTLLYKLTGTENIDEWFSEVKPEIFEQVREYFLSFGWDFMIEFAKEDKQIDMLFYSLLPSELNDAKDYLKFED